MNKSNILSINASSAECVFSVFNKDTGDIVFTETHQNRRDLLNIITSVILNIHQEFSFSGIVVYSGTGSFTGNRIAVSASNTFGWLKKIPVVSTTGDNWLSSGIVALDNYDDINYFGANVIYPEF